jgi:hypothetical protein
LGLQRNAVNERFSTAPLFLGNCSGDNCLPQRNAAVVSWYLFMMKNRKAGTF